jgi:hypothetical protein
MLLKLVKSRSLSVDQALNVSQADPVRTAKWVAFLANPPAPKRGSKAAKARQRLGITEDEVVFAGVVALHHRSAT